MAGTTAGSPGSLATSRRNTSPYGHLAFVPPHGEHQGTAPMMAVSEVIKMGRRRAPTLMIASLNLHRWRSWLMNSMRMPFWSPCR